jgi:hypothetical protein
MKIALNIGYVGVVEFRNLSWLLKYVASLLSFEKINMNLSLICLEQIELHYLPKHLLQEFVLLYHLGNEVSNFAQH